MKDDLKIKLVIEILMAYIQYLNSICTKNKKDGNAKNAQ